jgi:hypothetical protein
MLHVRGKTIAFANSLVGARRVVTTHHYREATQDPRVTRRYIAWLA